MLLGKRTMTLAHELAERIHHIEYDHLTPTVLDWTRAAFVDTIAVTLAGSTTNTAQIPLRVPGIAAAPGPCLVFGTDKRTSALDASFVNGVASHALDYDDVSGALGGHPSVPLVAPLIALAEQLGTPGRDVALAYAVGFETECRVARGVHFHHYDKGWHPTATLGIFGTVAGAARLLAFTPEQTATAIGLAASFASGLKANFGTMTKPLHVGHCARNGLLAALLAAEGFTANPGAFEHKQGFLQVFNGAGNYDAAAILRDWANPLDITRPGVAIKQYPCCGSTHPAVDAMLALVREHDIAPASIERVDSWTHPRRLAHTNRPDPNSALDAKFSVQYCLARAALDRQVTLAHFSPDAHRDPDTRAMLARIHAAPHPQMSMASTDHFGGEVRITLKDGSVMTRRVDQPVGRDADHPLPQDLLEAKFLDCATRALAPDTARHLLTLLRRLDDMPRIIHLTAAMLPAHRAAA
jgi:2-methylcitrate dehydratase PrpD